MQVDRATFLALASAIASCAPAPATAPAAPPPAPVTSAEPPPVVGEPQQNTPLVTTPPTVEGYWPPQPTSEGGYYPPPPKLPTPPFNASACSGDDIGSPGSCAGLKFDKSCAPFPFVTEACNDAIKFYKPKIAERAVSCIQKQSPKKLCDAMNTYHCKDVALRSACIDPSADASCNAILAKCPATSMAECRGYLSGMNDTGRAEMVKCMAGPNGCSWGLYSCTEGL
ncbi:MAG: hypothetical protein ACXVEF_04680 [Polyangiales bacterium]